MRRKLITFPQRWPESELNQFTTQDAQQETFVVYFENPEGFEEGVRDLHNTIT